MTNLKARAFRLAIFFTALMLSACGGQADDDVFVGRPMTVELDWVDLNVTVPGGYRLIERSTKKGEMRHAKLVFEDDDLDAKPRFTIFVNVAPPTQSDMGAILSIVGADNSLAPVEFSRKTDRQGQTGRHSILATHEYGWLSYAFLLETDGNDADQNRYTALLRGVIIK